MENTGIVPEQNRERRNRLFLPFLIALIGVLLMVVSLFLPYMTAVGDMAKYIEKNPDRVEIESLKLTASDLANVPIISVGNIITGVYGEDDGQIANIIVMVFVSSKYLSYVSISATNFSYSATRAAIVSSTSFSATSPISSDTF